MYWYGFFKLNNNLSSGVGVQDDGGARVPQAQRRRQCGWGGVVGDGGEELEEPALAEAGEDGAAQPAVQPPERDPRQAGDHRGAQQGQVRARVVQNVSSIYLLRSTSTTNQTGVKVTDL